MALLKISIPSRQSGFSLIEMLVVIGIFIFLASLGLFVSIDVYRNSTFRNETKTVVSVLQRARSQSLANINQAKHGVHIDYGSSPKIYIIFQGDSYATRDASKDVTIASNASVTPSGMTDVVFNQLTGLATVSGGNLTLHDGVHADSVISINGEGRITW